ncbi:uncharacterized protein [Amphiura filiformis]|uniref:uncharacterized protein n=1 Tax=Amphiura filiformis TaxID=82378 RepID=UPI003B227DC0
MGASSSQHAPGTLPAHQQIAIPQDPVPYTGPQIQYCLVDVLAQLSTQVKLFSTTQMITTNVDQYYQVISQPYEQGFVMQQFQKIPGVQSQAGFSSVAVPYQAILQRPVNVSTHERWQLKIEKSHLQTQAFVNWGPTQQVAANTTEIQQKIMEVAAQNGRLICIEVTGFQRNQQRLFSGVNGISGVDLFFNMPLHPNPTRYVYQAVNVPISFKMKSSFPSPVIQMETDVIGQFSAFLNQGWKLVEINFDMSQHMTQTGFTTVRGAQNSIWFFEKEANRLNDIIPVWQGCVVEYMHKVTASFGGTYAKTGWNEVLTQMGQRGWELACILETPEQIVSFGSVTQKLLMFFQRRILSQPQGAPAGYPPSGTPAYPPAGPGGNPPGGAGYPPPGGASYPPLPVVLVIPRLAQPVTLHLDLVLLQNPLPHHIIRLLIHQPQVQRKGNPHRQDLSRYSVA